MAALDREFKFYQKNKQDLLAKYENKFIVIIGHQVVGAFDDHMEAIESTRKKHKLGTFLVQRVTRKDKVHQFHSPLFSKDTKESA